MSEQAWEFCRVRLDGMSYNEKGDQYSFDCTVQYFGEDGTINNVLSRPDQLITYNPFSKAMALLGSYGWELVSVQHGNVETSEGSIRRPGDISPTIVDGLLVWDRVVAYFKRPIIAGRAVDQPELRF